MTLDALTKNAIRHTYHCLIGCGIGEVVGMFIAASLGWDKIGRLSLAIILAFAFGYGLTYRGVRKEAKTAREAMQITVATDTVSIATMEVVDNTVEFLIPNALMVTPMQPRFWWGLAVSLLIAFVVTVPVNRYMMSRGSHHHH
jgi:hypothetical protein